MVFCFLLSSKSPYFDPLKLIKGSLSLVGLSEEQVNKIVEQQKTKYQIEEDFDKFLREVQDKDGPAEDGEAATFV